MFAPGDVVVYRHYVCKVVEVKPAYFEGKDYFELHALFEKSLKLYVAIDDAVSPVVRNVMDRERALALIDGYADARPIDEAALRDGKTTATLLERKIKEEYDKCLRALDPEDLLPIIKTARLRTLAREEAGRKATATDKKYLDLALGLMLNELSLSLEMDREATADFVAARIGFPVEV